MRDLVDFIEKEINKKINIFEYKNEDLKENQELITFNNSLYVIEIEKERINIILNNYYYLVYQQNLDYCTLEKVLYNLFENINVIKYKKYLLITSKSKLNIDNNTTEIIELETYSKTYIFDLGKIDDIDMLDLKLSLFNQLLPTIQKNNNSNKFFSTKDLILSRSIYTSSKDKHFCSLIDFKRIKDMDENLLYTGIIFIENDLNISKTSSALFLHRNTLIYRLEKIKELFNLDLKNFKDAMVFYLSINTYFISKNQ